ncbi:MAG: FAD-dependent oxidoreductase [Clostridia bacterium]|nr:FAD-dependent oxidoreductase [Clostridia bacterium]
MKYPHIFQKGKIGNVTIKNRVAITAMGMPESNGDGTITREYIDYVTARAKGGVGLFITGVIKIDDEYGRGDPFHISADDDKHILSWRRLADSVHKYDTKIFAQLWHPGRQTRSKMIGGRQVVSSGNVPDKIFTDIPRPLTVEEIHALVKKFASAAGRVQRAGVDGVELHAAHSYLLHQFISPSINNRTDEYGGSFENRMRIIKEIVDAIRKKCGPHFPVSVRISATENVSYGYELDYGIKVAEYLDKVCRVDLINVSNGVAESSQTIQEPPTFPQGWKIDNGRQIKKHVSVPVLATSQIRQPAYAEELLAEGAVDFVGISRGHLADPEWCNKAKRGEELAIRPCISCLYCFTGAMNGLGVRCAVNPVTMRESELSRPEKTGAGRVVAIIGGGPAGLEAARVLSEREFKVVLFEKSGKLGGALNLANKPLHKERIDWLIDNMTYQVKKAGVDIRLNTAPTIGDLKALDPYAVFVTTGCKPLFIPFPGFDKPHVHSVVDYLNGSVDFENKKIAVIGGGTTGCEVAEKLSIVGKNRVTVVEMREDIGLDMYRLPRRDFMLRLDALKVERMPDSKLKEITDTGIVCENIKTSETVSADFDAVILALGFAPENSIVEEIEREFDNVRVLGDAVRVRKIADAIFEGYTRAFVLE